MDIEALKTMVCDEVDRWADRLVEVSHQIHAHPELNFEEHFAHDTLTAALDDAGLTPTRRVYGTDTGFEARAGATGPCIAVLLEYDALPGIGHACGHNVIAAAGLGAGIAAASAAAMAAGRVRILGTPAEEGGGGKIRMARRGAFDGVDAAMMVHPADADLLRMDTLALQELHVDYEGRAAHASAAPHEGRNALDAAVLGYVAVGALRQHIRPTERVHGVFTKAGEKANIVPREAAAEWMVRSDSIEALQDLKARVFACLESGAHACGCTMRHRWQDHTYADLRDNRPMAVAYAANAARLGRTVADPDLTGHHVVGSTDMGNVSYLVPSIHPMIALAPPGTPIHTPDFAVHAVGPEGDQAVIDGAKAMAMTVVDLWSAPGLLDTARADFGEPGDPRLVL